MRNCSPDDCDNPAAEQHARNVILFIADATGIPALGAASIHGHGAPGKLFVQQMPHIALSETSSADNWTTDSAAGMTAIVTGVKTDNGVLSQSPGDPASRKPLKTILEYAEERGLSTGVISNGQMADATPAACYAHAGNRELVGEIFSQVLSPRFGDGVDLVLGFGREEILAATGKLGIDLRRRLKGAGYSFYTSPTELSGSDRRVVALFDSDEFDMSAVVDKAITILSKNPKGFFLMIEQEVDTRLHEGRIELALKRVLSLDEIARSTARRMGGDTLILFTADHSFDFRVRSAKKSQPLLSSDSGIRIGESHTGEEVLISAQGPGAKRVRGVMANTEIFNVMLNAFGWRRSPLHRNRHGPNQVRNEDSRRFRRILGAATAPRTYPMEPHPLRRDRDTADGADVGFRHPQRPREGARRRDHPARDGRHALYRNQLRTHGACVSQRGFRLYLCRAGD